MTTPRLDERQCAAAAARVRERLAARAENVRTLDEPDGIANADTRERVAKRLDRLMRYHLGERLPRTPSDVPSAAEPERLLRDAAERVAASDDVPAITLEDALEPARVLERVINNADFLEFRYLDAGDLAGRAVGRIVLRDQRRQLAGYGTGSLVSPRLLLTNHHVLPDAATALRSVVQFDYQDDVEGHPVPEQQFGFDPDAFFVSDEERDFALVAVAATAEQLARFGFNPLIRAEGKAIVGERVTIVQHPGGEKKQVVLRDQQIVDIPDTPFLYYLADTERGSSGSPVFNDQWEVIAVHHASVRRPEASPDDRGYVNEGVRVSRILAHVDGLPLDQSQRALLGELVVRSPTPVATREAPQPVPDRPATKEPAMPAPVSISTTVPAAPDGDGWVQVTVPLEIRLRLGGAAPATARGAAAAPEPPPTDGDREAVVIDPDWAAREGFDTAFLGVGQDVPLPELAPAQLPLAAVDASSGSPPTPVLRYHHFSVVMNGARGLAFWVGVNIDGSLHRRGELPRGRDRWFFDPRIPREQQIGEDLYARNPLDRGHLVRRLDPAWGADLETAKKANDDTFHFTNCTPQHEHFNQRTTSWAGLENYILDNADNRNFKASVFTGPVFADDDDEYRGVQLPREFWKVAVMVKRDGTLSATGYLLSQAALIRGLESDEEFNYGAYRTFQVGVAEIERKTGLSFGPLSSFDPFERLELAIPAREIDVLATIVV